jgi:hypothetical protein
MSVTYFFSPLFGGKRIAVNPPAHARRIGVHRRDADRAWCMGVITGVLERGELAPAAEGADGAVRIVGRSRLRGGGVEAFRLVVVRKARGLFRAQCGRSLRHAAALAAVKVDGGLHALHQQQHQHARLQPDRQRARRTRRWAGISGGI